LVQIIYSQLFYVLQKYRIFAVPKWQKHQNKKFLSMSSQHNFGKKGAFFGKLVLTIILFIIMLIWIYQKNGHMVPQAQ